MFNLCIHFFKYFFVLLYFQILVSTLVVHNKLTGTLAQAFKKTMSLIFILSSKVARKLPSGPPILSESLLTAFLIVPLIPETVLMALFSNFATSKELVNMPCKNIGNFFKRVSLVNKVTLKIKINISTKKSVLKRNVLILATNICGQICHFNSGTE